MCRTLSQLMMLSLLLHLASTLSNLSERFGNGSKSVVPTVKSHGATYIGLTNSTYNVESWLSVRYAKPPTGSLRLQPPLPLKIEGTVNATQYGSACFQMVEASDPLNALSQSEDCLTLNIFRPCGVSEASLVPVLIWIHGGAFASGSGIRYNADSFGNRSAELQIPVIVVSVSYRLNFLGFSAGATAANNSALNLGLLDQRLALEWVKENIEAFGGDPNKVTIVGESAGATSVGLQMIAYGGREDGLFRSAILESGSAEGITPCPPPTYPAFQSAWDKVMAALNCTNVTDPFTCVQSIPEAQLFSAVLSVGRGLSAGSNSFPWRPVVDGTFIQDLPSKLVADHKVVMIPIIIGYTTDELTYFVPTYYNISSDAFLVGLGQVVFPGLPLATIEELVALDTLAEYPDVGVGGVDWKRSTAIVSDVFERCPGRAFALNHTAYGVWKYRWNAIIPAELSEHPWEGVVHSSDITYVFGPSRSTTINAPQDIALSRTVQKAWISFAASGNPNNLGDLAPGLNWPKYNASAAQVLVFQIPNEGEGALGKGLYMETDTDDRLMCDFITANDGVFGR